MCKTPCCDSSSSGSVMTPVAVIGVLLLAAAVAGPAVAAATALIHLVVLVLEVLACVAGAAGLALVGVAVARSRRHVTSARARLRGQVIYGLPQGRVADTRVEGSGSTEPPAIDAPSWPHNPHLGRVSSSAAGTGRHAVDSQVRASLDAGRHDVDDIMMMLDRLGIVPTEWQRAMVVAAFADPDRPLSVGPVGRRW